jgi:inhibitor of cysteine peptidase
VENFVLHNPSTGLVWPESFKISDQTIVQHTDHKYVAPEAEAGTIPVVGAPGTEVWTFKASKKGTSTIYMEYGRPWEGGEKGEWTFRLTVVVK